MLSGEIAPKNDHYYYYYYADDDAALPVDGLQRSLDVILEIYLRGCLIVNTTKTNVLSASSRDAPLLLLAESDQGIQRILSAWGQIYNFLAT